MLSIEDLPKDLQPFAEIGGVEKAAKYALRVGGYPVNLRHYDGTAKTTNEDMREIIRHFGAANASKIFATLGSGQVLIPNCVGVIRKRRNDNIVTMRKNGAKINDIALTHKLTTRTVFTILAGRRAKQADKPKLGGIKRTTSKMRRKSIIS